MFPYLHTVILALPFHIFHCYFLQYSHLLEISILSLFYPKLTKFCNHFFLLYFFKDSRRYLFPLQLISLMTIYKGLCCVTVVGNGL